MTRAPVVKIPQISEGEEALAMQIRLHIADFPPIREFPFDPEAKGRKWRFDFAWPEWMIAVEVEGGIHVGGHVSKGRFAQDAEKYARAALAGWLVLRFPTEWVVDGTRSMDKALGFLMEALTLRVTRYCRYCHWQWRPLAQPTEAKRHEEFAPGLRRCQGHNPQHCSPGCTSDHK